MKRNEYKLFSAGCIKNIQLKNRLLRSATWDPVILVRKKMIDEVLEVYRKLAAGGVGLIITGSLLVYRDSDPNLGEQPGQICVYDDLRVDGLEKLPAVIHQESPDCKVFAQLECGYLNAGPSDYPSPFRTEPLRPLTKDEIKLIIDSFSAAVADIKRSGFDGVQLHAAHGGLLSTFLSPYTNRREDAYGGSVKKRARIVKEIVAKSRLMVGDFPIIIKMNGTDNLPGGIDENNVSSLANELVLAGIDAIEVSGGMWECLARPKSELGFRPVPAPESHTRINSLEKQSYFLKYARQINIDKPVILVGGNRDVEMLEQILREEKVDFIAISRPLIREPDLPNRWREGVGSNLPECVSCNSCLYEMYVHPGKDEPDVVRCVCSQHKELHHQAQKWLSGWVSENIKKDK